MERNTETKVLSFSKGMTNMPSDLLSGDDELQESYGFIYRDGEMKPLQKEKTMFDGATKLPILFVHKHNGYKHYIALKEDNTLTWYDEDGTITASDIIDAPTLGSDIQIQAVGNTLVVNSSDSLEYYLWKTENGNYKYLGSKIPELDIKFTLSIGTKSSDQRVKNKINGEGIIKGVIWNTGHATPHIELEEDKEDDYKNLIIGLYSKNKNEIMEQKGFCNPFFVRAAVEMFDGSLTAYTVPILAFPCIGENSVLAYISEGSYFVTNYATLLYKQLTDYSEWGDIINKIHIGIARPVDLYNTSEYLLDGVSTGIYGIIKNQMKEYDLIGSLGVEPHYFRPFKKADVRCDLKEVSVFNILCEIPPETTGNEWCKMSDHFKAEDLQNLSVKKQIGDDYYTHCILSARNILELNKRVNLFNVNRSFWHGPKSLIMYDTANTITDYDVYVFIHASDGNRIVHEHISTQEKMWQHYFFYPDPRAYKVRFVSGKPSGGVELKLEEHPHLNGAYYLGDLPQVGDIDFPAQWIEGKERPVVDDSPEELRNQIWTSEVNNPWIFPSKGNNTIGSGEVLGIASQTTALSQGQFGQYPLIAFCSDGIWALKTDDEGLYSAVHPMSREVCNNPDSVIETDGFIFFTTEKGLMVVNGNQVTCVSERMNGKVNNGINLRTCLRGCFIAYDYRDSMLWIINEGETDAFVYNIKDGTFGMKQIPKVKRVINDYPDTLLQDMDGRVYSLLEKPNINEDSNTYSGSVITRPLKLGGSITLKSLRKIRHMLDTAQGVLNLEIWASNNTREWCQLHSLRGKPWSYFVFKYELKDFKACDSFSGSIVDIQNRRKIKY